MPLRDSNCAGFYHWPPIWVGNSAESVDSLRSDDPNTIALHRNLQCGVVAKVSLKGLFVFDFSNWQPGALETTAGWEVAITARIRFMNLLLACLYSTVFRTNSQTMEKMFIDHQTYAFAREFSLHPFRLGCDSRQAAIIRENEQEHRDRYPWHCVVSTDTVSKSLALADAAVQNEANDAAILAELLLHAFHLNDSGMYEASHTSAWTVAERCINKMWRSNLDDAEREQSHYLADPSEKFINAKRRQKLEGPDFTASAVCEVLSLQGILPFEQYKLANQVRQARNGWLHRLRGITKQDSITAINLAQWLLSHSDLLDVEIPFHVIESVPIAVINEDGKTA